MKKRLIVMLISMIMLCTLFAGTTYAYLVSRARPITNTFVSGNIKLMLVESTGSKYTLSPGVTIEKDPRVTVGMGSVECWLFVKVQNDNGVNDLIAYSIENGWTALAGQEGVYYRRVNAENENKEFSVLKNDQITVKDSVTEEKLNSIGNELKMTFSAYAVQYVAVPTPEKAWELVMSGGDNS